MIPAMIPSHRPATVKMVSQVIGVGDSQLADQAPLSATGQQTGGQHHVADQRDDDQPGLHLAGDLVPNQVEADDGEQHGIRPDAIRHRREQDGEQPLRDFSSSHMNAPYTGA